MKRVFAGRIESSAILGSLLVILFFAIGTKGLWLKNLPNILVLTAQVGIITIGQALLLTSGEVDLSVGSVFAFVGVAFILFIDWGFGVVGAFFCAILISSVIGLINGLITVKFKVPSMIVTLGALFIYRGCVYILTTGFSLTIPNRLTSHFLIRLVGGKFLGISNSIPVLILLTVVSMVILSQTRFGNHVTAVGGDPRSALSCGVSPPKIKTIAFVTCSLLAGLAGIIVTCQEGTVYSTTGRNLELDTIAAAVIGGCTLRGGVGSIWGAILGVFILSSLKGGLMMMGAPTYWYISFVGMILIGFLIVSKLMRGRYGISD